MLALGRANKAYEEQARRKNSTTQESEAVATAKQIKKKTQTHFTLIQAFIDYN